MDDSSLAVPMHVLQNTTLFTSLFGNVGGVN